LFNLTTDGLISLDFVEDAESCLDLSGVVDSRSNISPGSSLGSILGADSVEEVIDGAGGKGANGGGLSMSKMDLGGLGCT
jgi:hypothetical protein